MRTLDDSKQVGPPAALTYLSPIACAAMAPDSTRPQMAVTRNDFIVVICFAPSKGFQASLLDAV
jgi:hypothetical protein